VEVEAFQLGTLVQHPSPPLVASVKHTRALALGGLEEFPLLDLAQILAVADQGNDVVFAAEAFDVAIQEMELDGSGEFLALLAALRSPDVADLQFVGDLSIKKLQEEETVNRLLVTSVTDEARFRSH
jgi:hypothetical protein